MSLSLVDTRFGKWSPAEARRLAETIKEKWDAVDAEVSQRYGAQLCRLCRDPGRVTTDTDLLLGVGMHAIAARYPGYDHRRVRTHLNQHVMPAVSGALAVEPKLLLAIPFPADAAPDELDRWFVTQYFAIRNLSLSPREKGSPDLKVTLMAMDRMRQVLDDAAKRPPKPPKPANGENAGYAHETADDPDVMARVREAFSRSGAHEARERDPEDFDGYDGSPSISDTSLGRDAKEGDH